MVSPITAIHGLVPGQAGDLIVAAAAAQDVGALIAGDVVCASAAEGVLDQGPSSAFIEEGVGDIAICAIPTLNICNDVPRIILTLTL